MNRLWGILELIAIVIFVIPILFVMGLTNLIVNLVLHRRLSIESYEVVQIKDRLKEIERGE